MLNLARFSENICFPANSGVVIGKGFTSNGVTYTPSNNPRTNLPFNIVGDGSTLDREQIQDLLDSVYAYGGNSILYLPNSTYLIDSALIWGGYLRVNGSLKINVTVSSGSNIIGGSTGTFTGAAIGQTVEGTGIRPGTTITAVSGSTQITISQNAYLSWNEGNRQKRAILQGQSTNGTIIKLTNNNPNYQNPASPVSIINMGQIPEQRFRSHIRNLTIDCGVGNSGAVALRALAHNQGGVSNIKVISSDPGKIGRAGIDIAYSGGAGPMIIENCLVEGYNYGIWSNHPVAGAAFYDIKLEGQLQYGIYNGGNTPQPLHLENIESINSVPAYYEGTTGLITQSAVYLINCYFHNNGTPTANTAVPLNRSTTYIRNLVVEDYAKSLTNPYDGTDLTGNVELYQDYSAEHLGYFGGDCVNYGTKKSLLLPIEDLPYIPLEQDFSKWVTPIGRPEATFRERVQAAIDTPGATTLYFPLGDYTTDGGTIYLRGDIQRVIGTEAKVGGTTQFVIDEGTADTIIIERLAGIFNSQIVNISNRDVILSSITIDTNTGGRPSFTNDGRKAGINKRGTGDLFIQDMASDSIEIYGINCWARQLNVESASARAKVILNDGATFWGWVKTEKEVTAVLLKNNSRAEVFGLFYATSDGQQKVKPIFESHDSYFFSPYVEASYASLPYQLKYIDVLNGVYKNSPRKEAGTNNTSGKIVIHRHKADRINTKKIAPSIVDVNFENLYIKTGEARNSWNEAQSLSNNHGKTFQPVIEIHLSDFRDCLIQNNLFNGLLSVFTSKSKNIEVRNNKFDFEKVGSIGDCIYLHDTLKVSNNVFLNYGIGIRCFSNKIQAHYADIDDSAVPIINNNLFLNPTNNAMFGFSGNPFDSFPMKVYNNTIITKDQTKPPMVFGNFSNSSANRNLALTVFSFTQFENNIFYSVNATSTSGLPTTGNTVKDYNSFFNTTPVGTNTNTSDPNFVGSLGSEIWQYELEESSPVRSNGVSLPGYTPALDVSRGALQYGEPWRIESEGKTRKTVNSVPFSETASQSWGSSYNILLT